MDNFYPIKNLTYMKYLFLILFLAPLMLFSQCENDSINPQFINFNFEPTVSCDSDLSLLIPEAIDDCDTLVEVYYYEEIYPGSCSGNTDIFRVYRGFDDNGNGVIETQLIHIVDEYGPEFDISSSQIILDCPEIWTTNTPIAWDNCSDIDTLILQTFQDASSICNWSITNIWTAIDGCGNSSTVSQIIQFIDTIAPQITGEVYLEFNQGDPIDNIFITIQDNCGSLVTTTYTDTEVSGNSIIRNYTVTDLCGNSSQFEQILHFRTIDVNNLVAICHRTGNGSYHTIWVAPQAVQAHLNHGDYLGPCQEVILVNWKDVFPHADIDMKVKRTEGGELKKVVRLKN